MWLLQSAARVCLRSVVELAGPRWIEGKGNPARGGESASGRVLIVELIQF